MATIRVTDLDVSPDMTKVVAVGIVYLPPTPQPPSSTGDLPPQLYTPGYSVQVENSVIVYDLITKQTIACVSLSYVLSLASDARSIDRSLKLDGEIFSVRISYDSRYALINHAPGVGFHYLLSVRPLLIRESGCSPCISGI